MARRRRRAGSPPPDELRCHRNDGKTWRCSEPRFHGKIYCRHHFLSLEARMAAAAGGGGGSSSKKHQRSSTVAKKPSVTTTDAKDSGTGQLKAPKTTTKVRRSSSRKGMTMPIMRHPFRQVQMDGRAGDDGSIDTNILGRGIFEVGQVWVVPHEACGFPLAYARIECIGATEGTVEVTLLEYHPTSEEERRWADDGIPVACGLFRVTDSPTMTMDLGDLSHLVALNEELHDEADISRTSYRIFPRRGEIWAVYHKWDEREKGFVRKLVEVVSGFNDEEGEVTVAALILVEGTDAVFQRQSVEGFELFRTLSRSELLRFSHQVPAFKILAGRKTDLGKIVGKSCSSEMIAIEALSLGPCI